MRVVIASGSLALVTLDEGTVPVLPDHRDRVQVVFPLDGPTTPAPTPAPQDTQDISEDNNEENGAPAAVPPARKKLTIRVPGR